MCVCECIYLCGVYVHMYVKGTQECVYRIQTLMSGVFLSPPVCVCICLLYAFMGGLVPVCVKARD